MKYREFNLVHVILAAVLVTACGGGGGGGGSDGTVVKTWGTPVFVETIDTQHAIFPQVAVDDGGNAIAIWLQLYETTPSNKYHVWTNRYSAATRTWGTPTTLSTGTEDSYSPAIAVNAAGDAVVAWTSRVSSSAWVLARMYSASSGLWGPGRQISFTTYQADINSGPGVAIDASGNAIVAWSEFYAFGANSTRRWVWARRLATGGIVGTAVQVDIWGNSAHPKIALTGSGDALAVWEQHDGTRWNIWSSRSAATSGSLWTSPVALETDSLDARSVVLAAGPGGNAIAMWAMYDGTRNNIWANRFDATTGRWGTAEIIETGSGDAALPQVGMDNHGNAMAVWHQHDGMRNNVWSNRYTAGTGHWGVSALIETDNGDIDALGRPTIAVNGSGNAVAVWAQSDSVRTNIWANRYSAGSGWGAAQLIESEDGWAYYADIGLDISGNAIAVWTQLDGTRNNIRANTYR